VPDVPFGIAAGEGLAAIVFALEFYNHLCPGSLRFGVHGVSIGDDEVGCLCLRTANFIRLFHDACRRRSVVDRADHDHAVAERELSVHDDIAGASVDRLFLEPEGSAQPIDHLYGVSVAETRDHS
jgi:hypothetical protein